MQGPDEEEIGIKNGEVSDMSNYVHTEGSLIGFQFHHGPHYLKQWPQVIFLNT